MCFKYFPPRATASPLHLVVTIAGSTMKNSWWVILSSFTCFWIREYNWICTLHGTHRIPEHYFQMIVILFYLLQTMNAWGWGKLCFHFLHFDLSCRHIQSLNSQYVLNGLLEKAYFMSLLTDTRAMWQEAKDEEGRLKNCQWRACDEDMHAEAMDDASEVRNKLQQISNVWCFMVRFKEDTGCCGANIINKVPL